MDRADPALRKIRVSSPTLRDVLNIEVARRNERCSSEYVKTVSAPAAIMVQPIASPSRPSVRFTAFDEPTTTTIINNRNGRKFPTATDNGCRECCGPRDRDEILQERNNQLRGIDSAVQQDPGERTPAARLVRI